MADSAMQRGRTRTFESSYSPPSRNRGKTWDRAGELQSMGSQRVGHNLGTKQQYNRDNRLIF